MTTAKTWTLSRADLRDVTFATMPRDGGQIVEVNYGLWVDGAGGGLVIRRTHDRSDGEITFEAAEAGETFEPWNGVAEIVGEFAPLVVR